MALENYSLEERDQLAQLASMLNQNPETRKEFLKLTKKVNPDLAIPELEIDDMVDKRVTAAEKRAMALEAKLKEKEAMEDLKDRRQALIKKGLATSEDDVAEIEKVMLEKGITNHEAAADYWKWMQQAAEPTPTGYNPQVLNKFNLSDYYKNPVGAARNEAAKALQELRKNTRPIGI